jgi:hypothetical protein
MMSKERELLQKILTAYRKDESCMSWGVANKIEELLAQPEQEPVAWMYDWKTPVGKNREVQHVFTSKNHLTTDLTHILNDIENVRPLYTAPPTRVSLREHIDNNKEWYQIGYEKAKQELKRKSLSTKQAEDLWETTFKSAVPYYIFDEIVVAAEQYHDIRDDYE